MDFQRSSTCSIALGALGLLTASLPTSALPSALEEECITQDCGVCELVESDPNTLLMTFLGDNMPATYCSGMSTGAAVKAKQQPTMFYGQMIRYRDDLPKVIDTLVKIYKDRSTEPGSRAQLLDLGSMFPNKFSKAAVASLWDSHQDAFSMQHLVSFGESGTEDMLKRIEKLGKREVLPAAYLALRGDDRGAKLLRKTVKQMDLSEDNGVDAAMAAVALAQLGDATALERVRDTFEFAALYALDEGNFERARDLALGAEFLFKELVQAGKQASLAWISVRSDQYIQKRSAEVADAKAVFAVVEGLRS